MFGICWRFKWVTFYIGSLRVNLILVYQGCQNDIDPQWTNIESYTFTRPHNSKHVLKTYQTWKVSYAKRPTPDQNYDIIEGYWYNFIMFLMNWWFVATQTEATCLESAHWEQLLLIRLCANDLWFKMEKGIFSLLILWSCGCNSQTFPFNLYK